MENLQINDIVVMLVEPSSMQQKIIQQSFSELGINNILLYQTAEEALADMATELPDVVISALYLPDMNGTDLVHRMREDEELHDIGFILISSETRFRYLDPIRQAGAIAILPKPFSNDELRIAMNNTLDYLDPDGEYLDEFIGDDINVLIVDDSSLARKQIKRLLTSLGIENFFEANDGLEAQDQLSEHYFDLVVTDYNMPNMDGRELVDFIRSQSSQSSIPILMVTSEENESRLAAIQQAGVSAICDKPFQPENVRGLIRQILN